MKLQWFAQKNVVDKWHAVVPPRPSQQCTRSKVNVGREASEMSTTQNNFISWPKVTPPQPVDNQPPWRIQNCKSRADLAENAARKQKRWQ
jgi:hypothetical protein